MPFGTYDTPKPPTLPTFLQFVKTVGKGVEGKTKFPVDIVWMPGKFNNVTLQTHAFRYVCDEGHPLYGEIKAYFESLDFQGNHAQLDIVIISAKERTISLDNSGRKHGTWEKMGSNAYKFKVN